MRAPHYFRRLNILEDEAFTYGQRIALGQLFEGEAENEYGRLLKAFRIVYEYSPRLLPRGVRFSRITALVEELKEWISREQNMLHYTPNADELAAGVEELGKKVGSLGTVQALARSYGVDPDVVVAWPYTKVFGILYADLEENKYKVKYQKIVNARYSQHN